MSVGWTSLDGELIVSTLDSTPPVKKPVGADNYYLHQITGGSGTQGWLWLSADRCPGHLTKGYVKGFPHGAFVYGVVFCRTRKTASRPVTEQLYARMYKLALKYITGLDAPPPAGTMTTYPPATKQGLLDLDKYERRTMASRYMRLLNHALCINVPGFGEATTAYEASVAAHCREFYKQSHTPLKGKRSGTRYPPTPMQAATSAEAERLTRIYQYLEEHDEIRRGVAAVIEFGAMLCRCIATAPPGPGGLAEFLISGEKPEGTPPFRLPSTKAVLSEPHLDCFDGPNGVPACVVWSKTLGPDTLPAMNGEEAEADAAAGLDAIGSELGRMMAATENARQSNTRPVLACLASISADTTLSTFAMNNWLREMDRFRAGEEEESLKRRKIEEVTAQSRATVMQYIRQLDTRQIETQIHCIAASASINQLLAVAGTPAAGHPHSTGLEFIETPYSMEDAMQ